MKPASQLLPLAFLFVTAVSAQHVAAQESRDPGAAEALFKAGIALLEKNDWPAACAKFDASMKLDPSVGTQINLARCAEHEGKLARALGEYQKARVLNRETPGAQRKQEIDAFLEETIAKLDPRVPRLVLRVSPRPEGLRIERDGAELGVGVLGEAVPIDPGRHVITVGAPGMALERREVDIAEGSRVEHAFTLRAAPEAPRAPFTQAPSPAEPATAQAPSADVSPARGSSWMPIAGWAGVALGGASLAAAAITGGLAAGESSTVDDAGCEAVDGGASIRCPANLYDEVSAAADRGRTLSTVSTITLFAGGALAAAGVVLLLASPSDGDGADAALTPFVGPGTAGLSLGGRF